MIDKLLGPVTEVVGKWITAKDEKEKALAEIETTMRRTAAGIDLAQARINEVQAAHKSLFVAGARPAALWVCVIGLLLSFFDIPHVSIDGELLQTLLFGMLGLGGLRTVEKIKRVARER